VTGNSRLFYSQWEKPKHMLKESQKRQPKLTPPGSVDDFSYSAALAAHLKLRLDSRVGRDLCSWRWLDYVRSNQPGCRRP
jgi:hypothetical protein